MSARHSRPSTMSRATRRPVTWLLGRHFVHVISASFLSSVCLHCRFQYVKILCLYIYIYIYNLYNLCISTFIYKCNITINTTYDDDNNNNNNKVYILRIKCTTLTMYDYSNTYYSNTYYSITVIIIIIKYTYYVILMMLQVQHILQ